MGVLGIVFSFNKILLENILPAHVAEHYLLDVQGVSGILQDSNVMLSFSGCLLFLKAYI